MRTSSSTLIVTVVVFLVIFTGVADAGRVWHIQQINEHGRHSAVAMRSGLTWPVVAYSGSPGGVTALTPSGWASGPFSITGPTDAASTPEGTVGFADRYGGVTMLSPYGWSYSNYGYDTGSLRRPSLAFDHGGNPVVLHEQYAGGSLMLSSLTGPGWHHEVVGNYQEDAFYSESYALAIDSYGQKNVIFQDNRGILRYGLKGSMTGNQWFFSDPDPAVAPAGDNLDLALTVNDIPWAVYQQQQQLHYATYDVQTGSWFTGMIDTLCPDFHMFTIASDGLGGVGVAYLSNASFTLDNGTSACVLSYAHNNGSGGWSIDQIDVATGNSVGLVFDAENNPVISYTNRDGLALAYDPIVVPEPASCILLLVGGMGLLTRKR